MTPVRIKSSVLSMMSSHSYPASGSNTYYSEATVASVLSGPHLHANHILYIYCATSLNFSVRGSESFYKINKLKMGLNKKRIHWKLVARARVSANSTRRLLCLKKGETVCE